MASHAIKTAGDLPVNFMEKRDGATENCGMRPQLGAVPRLASDNGYETIAGRR